MRISDAKKAAALSAEPEDDPARIQRFGTLRDPQAEADRLLLQAKPHLDELLQRLTELGLIAKSGVGYVPKVSVVRDTNGRLLFDLGAFVTKAQSFEAGINELRQLHVEQAKIRARAGS